MAELAPLADPGLVPVAIAAAIGIEVASGAVTPESVARAIGVQRLLLVLDNCEHVIDAAAAAAEALLRANSTAHLIVTSREPLKVDGEWIYPVPPLALPAEHHEHEHELLQYGAVRLFLARAQAAAPHFAPDPNHARVVAAICRQLDGIPLAIELAAARAAGLGLEALAAGLDDCFELLTRGRRTALPRHQTLRATIDWSHELLSQSERILFRRLAVFAGVFSLEAVGAVVADDKLAPSHAVSDLANLIAKSLVVAEVDGLRVAYRLLDTTRAFAREKLVESSERDLLFRRHAEHYRDVFERAEIESETRPTVEWLGDHVRKIDDLRAALDWAFSPSGDAAIGVALTAAAVPLWMHLSLLMECHRRLEQALAGLAVCDPTDRGGRHMKLLDALGRTRIETASGPPDDQSTWTKALELAETLGDGEYRLRALWGQWANNSRIARFQAAVSTARSFRELAARQADPNDLLVGERILGTALHYAGYQADARHHIEGILKRYARPTHRSHVVRFHYDQGVMARCMLARVLWLQGFPALAAHEVQRGVDEARATDHALSLCQILAQGACMIAVLSGDLFSADRFTAMLIDHSTRHGLALWRAEGDCFEGLVGLLGGSAADGLVRLRAGVDALRQAGAALRYAAFASTMAEALGRAGQIAAGFAIIDEVVAATDQEAWWTPELLRVRAELVLLEEAPEAKNKAESALRQALALAHRQGALSWELRAATSLARLLRDQARTTEARSALQPVFQRFTEGFDTTDLKQANALLDSVR